MQSLENVSKLNKEFVDGAMKGAAVWTNGFQTLAAETADYAKNSMESGTAAFEKIAAAKTPEKALEMQADYAKSAFEGFVAQATKFGEIYTDMAKDAYKPFESLFTKAK